MKKKVLLLILATCMILGVASQATFAKNYIAGKVFTDIYDPSLGLGFVWERDITSRLSFDVSLMGKYSFRRNDFVFALSSSINYDVFQIAFKNSNLGRLDIGVGALAGVELDTAEFVDIRSYISFGPRVYFDWNINSKVSVFLKCAYGLIFYPKLEIDKVKFEIMEISIGTRWNVNKSVTLGLAFMLSVVECETAGFSLSVGTYF